MTSPVHCFSSEGDVATCISQLLAFQASVIDPRPETPVTSPSLLDPSHLHILILSVITIQFPHWMSGDIPTPGSFPIALAGPPKQIAAPMPIVRVGVTKIRRKLAAESAPRYHQAPRSLLQQVFSYPIGLGGHINGIAIHHHTP